MKYKHSLVFTMSCFLTVCLLCSCVDSEKEYVPSSPESSFPAASSVPQNTPALGTPAVKEVYTFLGAFPVDGYEYTPLSDDESLEEIAYKVLTEFFDDCKKEDPNVNPNLAFRITDYRNLDPGEMLWDDYGQMWYFFPQAEVAYTGYYGEIGESDGATYYFLYSDTDLNLGTDGSLALGIYKTEYGTYKIIALP